MNTKILRFFITVAEEENVGRAAERLNISQPPLTRHIKQLEEDVGIQLFLRTAKGVTLTDAGRQFLIDARAMLDLNESAIDRARRVGQGTAGTLDVGAWGSSELDVLPLLLRKYREYCPDVTVRVHSMQKLHQLDALRNHRLDIGINRLVESQPDLRIEPIKHEKIIVAIAETSPLARRETLSLRDLNPMPLVIFPAGTRPNFIDFIYGLFNEDGWLPKETHEVATTPIGLAMVAAGLGVALVPESCRQYAIDGLTFRPLRRAIPLTVDVSCFYLVRRHNPVLRSFLSVVHATRTEMGWG